MSNIDWLIVILAFIGAIAIGGMIGLVMFVRHILRDIDDPDDLPAPGPPYVETPIIRPNPDRAMARAAAEAGYITNANYIEVVDRINAAMADDIRELTTSELQFPRSVPHPSAASERPAPASAPRNSPAGGGLSSVEVV